MQFMDIITDIVVIIKTKYQELACGFLITDSKTATFDAIQEELPQFDRN